MSRAQATPLVSVCMPVTGEARHLEAALESVLDQTMTDCEIVVCDDGLHGGAQSLLQQFTGAPIRCVRHPRRRGVGAARNSCAAVARGRYIAWLDSDDAYLPTMLETQTMLLEQHPRVGFVYAGAEIVDEDGRRLPDWPTLFASDAVMPGQNFFRELILENMVTTSTVVMRRDALRRAGSFSSLGSSGEDWEMWLRVALRWDVAYSATPLARYRVHRASLSGRATEGRERLTRDRQVVRGVLRHEAVPDRARTTRHARASLAAHALLGAGDAFTRGRRRLAVIAAVDAAIAVPDLAFDRSWRRLVSAYAWGDEYTSYRTSKALLAVLAARLDGTWYGGFVHRCASDDPEWEQALHAIAATVRSHTNVGDRPAVIDKWDPTLLRLAGRRGWHFPDRRLLPGGYPRDSHTAIKHLEELRCRGATHLIVPCSARWWLDYYESFAEFLESESQRLWADSLCVIYALRDPSPPKPDRARMASP